jgi:putative alpha-1,2-mannosidase
MAFLLNLFFLLLSRFSVLLSAQNISYDPLQYVNQLIGSNNGGNVFAGASLPYGMAKASPDVNGENTGGFATDGSNVTGFSHMHDSGTGGNPSQGQFPLFPQICPDDVVDNCKFRIEDRSVPYDSNSVVATPGYFGLGLENGIHAEMTVTQHTALYNFKFPSGGSPLILLDLTDLWASRQNATVSVGDDGTIRGNGTFLPSFGSGYYLAYFCASFYGATVKDTGIWINSRAGTEPKEIFITRGINLFYLEGGAWVRFNAPTNGTVTARVGVSFVSTEQACSNAEREIADPLGSFDIIKKTAENAWREKLSSVSVVPGGASKDLLTSFYSAIYRTMMSPQNYTGENPLWESSVPYFDSFYW